MSEKIQKKMIFYYLWDLGVVLLTVVLVLKIR